MTANLSQPSAGGQDPVCDLNATGADRPLIWSPAILLTLVLFTVVQGDWLAWSATWQSPTLNEPGHLVSGLAHLELGVMNPYQVNPPLVRTIAALPVQASDAERSWAYYSDKPGCRSEFMMGSDFVTMNGERTQSLMVQARWACLPFCLAGIWLCYCWSATLFGKAAGLLAAGLWAVEPNLIGHGQLITPDVAATTTGLLAAWTFRGWLLKPGWGAAIFSGITLGLACLTKFSWLLLPVLWVMIWLVKSVWERRKPDGQTQVGLRKSLLQLAVMMFVFVDVVNIGYLCKGSFSRLDSMEFVSRKFAGEVESGGHGNRFRGTWLGAVPVPFPQAFVQGLDQQARDFESFAFDSYLRGEWKHGGWWYYYLSAALVKVPTGLWLLGLIALLVGVRNRRQIFSNPSLCWSAIVLVLPAMALFVTVSSQLEFNHHFRYVLPCFGAAIVLASASLWSAGRDRAVIVAVLAGWVAVSSVAAAPYSLGYFCELAGGLRNGSAHLLHSSVDWGQDLVTLKKWAEENPDHRPLFVAFIGDYDPIHYGVPGEVAAWGPRVTEPPRGRMFEPGWYAVSVSLIKGLNWRLSLPGVYTLLEDLQPAAWCGGSMVIYRIDEATAARLNEQAGQLESQIVRP